MTLLRLGSGLLMAATLGGCASVHVDEQGRRHVVGLVWLTLPPAGTEPVGAETLRVRSLGASLMRGPAGSGLVLGWSDSSVTVIRNDALVRLPAPAGATEEGR